MVVYSDTAVLMRPTLKIRGRKHLVAMTGTEGASGREREVYTVEDLLVLHTFFFFFSQYSRAGSVLHTCRC